MQLLRGKIGMDGTVKCAFASADATVGRRVAKEKCLSKGRRFLYPLRGIADKGDILFRKREYPPLKRFSCIAIVLFRKISK